MIGLISWYPASQLFSPRRRDVAGFDLRERRPTMGDLALSHDIARDQGRLSKEAERRKCGDAGATLVGNDRKTEMAVRIESEA